MTNQFLAIADIDDRLVCRHCGKQYVPYQTSQLYCTRACQHSATRNGARDIRRANHTIEFIGVDGEGVNIRDPFGITKEHRYIMLSVGDQTLWRGGRELTHHDIFPFLYEQFLESPNAAFVGFYLGYDFTMWLKSLTAERARMLFVPALRQRTKSGHNNPVPFPARVDGWELDILGLKRFKLRPEQLDAAKPYQWMYICDAGPFFQTSFLKAVDPALWRDNPPCTPEEYERLMVGKGARATQISSSDTSYYADMVKYNTLENSVLARTMTIVNAGFVQSGIRLSKDKYYGPGQVAQYWLTQQAKEHLLLRESTDKTVGIDKYVPKTVIDATIASYYGGWFEQFYHGHIPGLSYEYDITSAYPWIMSNLPCLCGQWTNSFIDNATLKLCYATVVGSNPTIGAMPYRNPRGNILRPNVVKGWYWWHELEASKRAGLIDEVYVEQTWSYQDCEHAKPLADLARLFELRLKAGKATPKGIGLKLTYNSAYGKFAQSVGVPKFGNPVYASLITAGTRAMICDAIASHPIGVDDVLMIATDAVYFRTRHLSLVDPQSLVEGESPLGGWEQALKRNLTLMKPGVYWDDKTRQQVRDKLPVKLKSRGISAVSLAANIGRIDDMFTTLATDLTADWPAIDISVPFSVVSPKLALARGKWETCGKVTWHDSRHDKCALAPKRAAAYLDNGLIRSRPMTIPSSAIETTPYDKRFGWIEETDADMKNFLVPEGTLSDAIGGWIKDLC